MTKDFLDLNIKNNLINQVRESTQRTNTKLIQEVKTAERHLFEIEEEMK